jgi:outer membrane protein W
VRPGRRSTPTWGRVSLCPNVDCKRVNTETDVKVLGTKLTTFKADPDLISVGIGWRF